MQNQNGSNGWIPPHLAQQGQQQQFRPNQFIYPNQFNNQQFGFAPQQLAGGQKQIRPFPPQYNPQYMQMMQQQNPQFFAQMQQQALAQQQLQHQQQMQQQVASPEVRDLSNLQDAPIKTSHAPTVGRGEYQKLSQPEFNQNYMIFMKNNGTPISRYPVLFGKLLDMCTFFYSVIDWGGVEKVNAEKKWKNVAADLNLPASAALTSALKKNYEKLLVDYEGAFYRSYAKGSNVKQAVAPQQVNPMQINPMQANAWQQNQMLQIQQNQMQQMQQNQMQQNQMQQMQNQMQQNQTSQMQQNQMQQNNQQIDFALQNQMAQAAALKQQQHHLFLQQQHQQRLHQQQQQILMAQQQARIQAHQAQQLANAQRLQQQQAAANPIHTRFLALPALPLLPKAEPIAIPPPLKEEEPYKPRVIKPTSTEDGEVDFWGGIPLDLVLKTVQPVFTTIGKVAIPKEILGSLDVPRLTRCVQSGLPMEICHALNSLILLSNDRSINFNLKTCPELADALIDFFESFLAPALPDYEHGYIELYDMNQTICAPPTRPLDEQVLACQLVFRNLSFMPENQLWFSKNDKVIKLLIQMLNLTHVDPHYMLESRKNALVIFSNIGLNFDWTSEIPTNLILKILVDFFRVKSPYRALAFDAWAKMSIQPSNVAVIKSTADLKLISKMIPALQNALPKGCILHPQAAKTEQAELATWELALIGLSNIVTIGYHDHILQTPGLLHQLLSISSTEIHGPNGEHGAGLGGIGIHFNSLCRRAMRIFVEVLEKGGRDARNRLSKFEDVCLRICSGSRVEDQVAAGAADVLMLLQGGDEDV